MTMTTQHTKELTSSVCTITTGKLLWRWQETYH